MSIKNPSNEQETIFWFIQRSSELGYEIVSFWSIFPDATILNKWTGETYKVEFEYKLSSFIKHRHDPRLCDLVVCWKNDIQSVPFPLTVWELREEKYPEITHPNGLVMASYLKMLEEKETYKSQNYKKNYLDIPKSKSDIFKDLFGKKRK